MLAILVFIPFFRRGQLTSAFEYLEERYGPAARLYGTLSFILLQLLRLAKVLFFVSIPVSLLTGFEMHHVIIGVGDVEEGDGAKRGVIALQLHAGPKMEIRFKDIEIKVLDEGQPAEGLSGDGQAYSGPSASQTAHAVTADPATPAAAWKPTAEQQEFLEHVATLTAPQQVAAVRGKLMEINPDFDGKLTHTIEQGSKRPALSKS